MKKERKLIRSAFFWLLGWRGMSLSQLSHPHCHFGDPNKHDKPFLAVAGVSPRQRIVHRQAELGRKLSFSRPGSRADLESVRKSSKLDIHEIGWNI